VDKIRCAWCGTDNDPGRTACTSCGTHLVPPQEGEPIWAVPPESVAPIPPRSTAGTSVPPEPASSPGSESWGAGPDPGTPQVPAAPSGVLHSTAAVQPQPLPMPSWPPTTTWPDSAPKASGSMAGALWAGIVVVVLVAFGFFLVQRMQSGISFPDTIAGYQHDESQIAEAATEFMEKTLKTVGVEAKAAIYGDLSTTGFMVIAFETDGSPLPGGLEDFATGFGASSGGSVDTGQAVTETRDGVNYRCAAIILDRPTTIGDPRAVCVWNDQDTGGFVIDAVSANTAAAMDLASNVHDSVG
jgi:hypothetical protein